MKKILYIFIITATLYPIEKEILVKIIDNENNPISYANIFCNKNGTTSNKDGFFTIICDENDTLNVKHISFNHYKEIVSQISGEIILIKKDILLSDVLILLDIYPSREKPIDNVSSSLIYDDMIKKGHKNIFLNSDISTIPNLVNKIYNKGDIIITMGAGDIYKQNNIIFEELNVS